MPRTCTICAHTEREAIDKALVNDSLSLRTIADRFNVSKSALIRHKADHLPATLAQAKAADDVAHADNLLDQVRELQARAMTILNTAEKSGDLRTALTAIREARGNLELLAKLLGELQQEGTTNILIAPEWITVRTAILAALVPHPQAALDVSKALAKVDHAG